MSKQESTQRQRAIINKLDRKPSTLEEIQNYLQLQEEITGDRITRSLRTFQRDIKEIRSLYEIEIKYDRSQRLYSIVHDGRESHSERLMEAFDLYNAIKVGNSFGNKLIFENRKTLGIQNMHGLLHAIKNNLEVSFSYRKYYDDSISSRNIQPAAIKEARNRWYLLGKDISDGKYKSFGLDRINDIEISRNKFGDLNDFDPQEEYRYSFGIINGMGEKPQKMVLSFTPREGRYIKSLPLHHSQHVVVDNEEECQFEYTIVPTYDLKMEILSYGNQVKVLEPESLKKEIITQLKAALNAYQ